MSATRGLPQGEEKARVVRTMFDRVAERYDLVNRVMTFGMDVGWRRRAVAELRLPGGSLVADLACGTGDLCNELHADRLSGDRVRLLARDAGERHGRTAPLVQADVLRLPLGRRWRRTGRPVGSRCAT